MEYPTPKIVTDGIEYEILSYDEFREKRGLPKVSNQTIINHMGYGSLDWTQIGRFRYVVWNKKAQNFNLNYNKQLTSN